MDKLSALLSRSSQTSRDDIHQADIHRVPSIAGDAARPSGPTGVGLCKEWVQTPIHQWRLTYADLDNSETWLKKVLWSFGVSPVSRGKGQQWLCICYHYSMRTFKT